MEKKVDYLSKSGAQELARTIRDYWRQKGVGVDTFVKEEAIGSGQFPIFVIRSNLPGILSE